MFFSAIRQKPRKQFIWVGRWQNDYRRGSIKSIFVAINWRRNSKVNQKINLRKKSWHEKRRPLRLGRRACNLSAARCLTSDPLLIIDWLLQQTLIHFALISCCLANQCQSQSTIGALRNVFWSGARAYKLSLSLTLCALFALCDQRTLTHHRVNLYATH